MKLASCSNAKIKVGEAASPCARQEAFVMYYTRGGHRWPRGFQEMGQESSTCRI